MIKLNRLSLLSLLLLFASSLSAQTVDEIFSGFFKNTGGIDARKEMHSLKIEGTAPSPRGEFPITLYTKKPDRIKVVLKIEGQDYIAQAYDGKVAWGLNPFQGGKNAQKIPDEHAVNIVEEADFDNSYVFSKFINYKSKGYTATMEGVKEIGDADCYSVKLSKKEEPDEYYYFDKKTYLLTLLVKSGVTKDNEKWKKEYIFDDYKLVNGVKLPYYYEVKVNDNVVRKLIAEKITLNSEISDNIFAFPN